MATKSQNQKADASQNSVKYTLNDCGCYVDGARGIYAIDAIVDIAESHGMVEPKCEHTHEETHDESRFAGCQYAGEIEDGCDEYMNDKYGVDGAYWGRSEQGDWGLWEVDSE